MNPRDVRAAHIVEQRSEWTTRGRRMRQARPADPSVLAHVEGVTADHGADLADSSCEFCGYLVCSCPEEAPAPLPVVDLPGEVEPRFKVGDRVRFTFDGVCGRVVRIDDDGDPVVRFDDEQWDSPVYASELEPAPPVPQEPEDRAGFAVGDRVCVSNAYPDSAWHGVDGTVTQYDDGSKYPVIVRLDDARCGRFKEDEVRRTSTHKGGGEG